MKYLVIALIVLVLAVPAGLYFGGVIHLGENAEEATAETAAKAELPPTYLPLDPPFVVNFTHRGTLRYLQVSLEVTYEDLALLTKVTERMPEVRNELILLFSGQDYEQLSTFEGKERLRGDIMRAINRVIGIEVPAAAVAVDTGSGPAVSTPALAAATGPGEVFITNFVMQ